MYICKYVFQMPINLCEIIYFDFLELVGFYKHTTHQGSKKNEDPNKVQGTCNNYYINSIIYVHTGLFDLVLTSLSIMLSNSLLPNFDIIKLRIYI